jgi:hypothetical protein
LELINYRIQDGMIHREKYRKENQGRKSFREKK